MKDRIIEMLERGERVVLECVDIKNAERIGGYRGGLITSEIIVHSIGRDGELIIGDGSDEDLFIAEEEFKYFKIKETARSFNDLVDTAVQAYKDGYIRLMRLDNDVLDISYNIDGDGLCGFSTSKNEESSYQFEQYIRDINFLYTETFVIEGLSDLARINGDIESLVLANGCDITERVCFFDHGLRLADGYGSSIALDIDVLKGATVTQKRGERK